MNLPILNDYHCPSVPAEGAMDALARSSRQDIFGEPVNLIRFSEIPDAGTQRRRERLIRIFGNIEIADLTHSDLSSVIQSQARFDVIIIGVDDIARLAAAMHPPADVLIRNKISFALSTKSNPRTRARLLRMGFDDALHLEMSDAEIIARFSSIVSRSNTYTSMATVIPDDKWRTFSEKYVQGRLQRRQIEIMKILVAAKGEAVPYSQLASFDYVAHSYRTDSLKVTISRLRQRLRGCDIASERGVGYRLVFAS